MITQYTVIVDDEGDVWPGGRSLSQYLRTERAGAELHQELIRNLGFIGITLCPGRIDIALDSRTVAPKALMGTIYWLNEQQFRPARLLNPQQPDLISLFPTRAALVAELSDRCFGRQSRSTVSRLPISLEQSAFATRWRVAVGICEEVADPRPRHRLLSDLFQGYFSILRRPTAGDDCIIDHIGDGYAAWDPTFHGKAVGRTFRDVFDKCAGAILADGYRDLCHKPIEPSAESVRALINFPGNPARRMNHDRMILPIGSAQVLVANFVH